jgi:hypothetical protein
MFCHENIALRVSSCRRLWEYAANVKRLLTFILQVNCFVFLGSRLEFFKELLKISLRCDNKLHCLCYKRRVGFCYCSFCCYRILQSSSEFNGILQSFTELYKTLQNYTELYRITQNSTEL